MGTHVSAVPFPIVDQTRARVDPGGLVVSHAPREPQLSAGVARKFRRLLFLDELLSVLGATEPEVGGRELGRGIFGKHVESSQGLQSIQRVARPNLGRAATQKELKCLYEEFNCEPIAFRIPTSGSGWGGDFLRCA